MFVQFQPSYILIMFNSYTHAEEMIIKIIFIHNLTQHSEIIEKMKFKKNSKTFLNVKLILDMVVIHIALQFNCIKNES
jgi:hypothetical protein